MHSKLGLWKARLGLTVDPGLLPSSSTSWGWGWDSQSRLRSLVFAKVVQRRLGPKGITRPLLRKEGWRAFSSILSTVPEPSKHNTPPASPAAALLWPGPFPLEFWLCSQLRPFFLPTSPPVSCLTPLGRPKLPSIGMWLRSHSSGGGGGSMPTILSCRSQTFGAKLAAGGRGWRERSQA